MWTIGELAERASAVLTAGGQRQASGRVREAPNDRLIRWYVTIGLVDPPLSRTGRVARYGRRHLLQLVAVKRQQADGRSLAEIQAELLGATDAYLESVAGLRDRAEGEADGESARAGSADARFWAIAARPGAAKRLSAVTAAPLAQAAGLEPRPGHEPQYEPEPPRPALEGQPADLLQGVRLAPGVLLLIDANPSVLCAADAAELRAAAAPLLAALARVGHRTATVDGERKQP